MKKITGNESINPTTKMAYTEMGDQTNPYNIHGVFGGLTIRQYYAGMALQGIIQNYPSSRPFNVETIAAVALKQSDALIAELNKSENEKETK